MFKNQPFRLHWQNIRPFPSVFYPSLVVRATGLKLVSKLIKTHLGICVGMGGGGGEKFVCFFDMLSIYFKAFVLPFSWLCVYPLGVILHAVNYRNHTTRESTD
jgi:hypothetical protein